MQSASIFSASEADEVVFTTSEADKKNAEELKQRMATSGKNVPGLAKKEGEKRSLTEELFPAVQIDEGTFKYVLIHAEDPHTGEQKDLVRGKTGDPYHADVARPTVEALEEAGIAVTVLGGGRIRHSVSEKKIEIFGFSYSFGQPDHNVTATLCKKAYPDYEPDFVTWTNEGY
jgi:phosphohistidine phosphatase